MVRVRDSVSLWVRVRDTTVRARDRVRLRASLRSHVGKFCDSTKTFRVRYTVNINNIGSGFAACSCIFRR